MECENIKQMIAKLLRSIYGLECIGHSEICDLMLIMHGELSALERLAKIGKATEKAYSKGAFLIYDVAENYDGTIERYNHDETIEELLGWLGSTESEGD